MKFFNGSSFDEYPDARPEDRDELRKRIFLDTFGGHQGYAERYFHAYFHNGGGKIHPILGDLKEFADEINEHLKEAGLLGPNKVPDIIIKRLGQLKRKEESESEHKVQSESMGFGAK